MATKLFPWLQDQNFQKSTASVLFSLGCIFFWKMNLVYLSFISRASNLNRIICEIRSGYLATKLFQSTMERSLPICNSCRTSATDTALEFPALLHRRQVRPSIFYNFKCNFSKKRPFLMLILFLQVFTGQRQVTHSTELSKACSLQ